MLFPEIMKDDERVRKVLTERHEARRTIEQYMQSGLNSDLLNNVLAQALWTLENVFPLTPEEVKVQAYIAEKKAQYDFNQVKSRVRVTAATVEPQDVDFDALLASLETA